MRAVKKINRKYYKEIITSFAQPVLKANGTMGGNSFAVSANSEVWGSAYEIFDNNNDSLWCAYSYAFTGGVWYQFYNPIPLNVTNIRQYTYQGVSGYGMGSGTIYASNDGNIWDTITNVSGKSGETINIQISTTDYYKYWRVYIAGNQGANQVKVNEVKITATTKQVIEGTKSDYTYYKDIPTYKLPKKTNRKYYKQQNIPDMTSASTPSNSVTLLSGSDYGTKKPWQLFNSSLSDAWVHPSTSTYSVRYTFDNPLPTGVCDLSMWYSTDDPKGGYYSGRYLDSYNIKFNYTDNTSETVATWNGHLGEIRNFNHSLKNKKQLKSIDYTFSGTVRGTFGCLYDFKIVHTYESTPDDYDYYIDTSTYYGINQ